MFDIILRYLYGFAKIHLRGIHINRFVNLCKARDIKLWNLEQKEDEIFFFTASKDIARLEEPARKTGSDVEVLRVYGIREFIRKNKKRIPFVAGFILFAVLIYIQSLFIWEISVSGESDYTSDEILQHINEYYVQTGTPKSKVDCAELEKNLRKDFEAPHAFTFINLWIFKAFFVLDHRNSLFRTDGITSRTSTAFFFSFI